MKKNFYVKPWTIGEHGGIAQLQRWYAGMLPPCSTWQRAYAPTRLLMLEWPYCGFSPTDVCVHSSPWPTLHGSSMLPGELMQGVAQGFDTSKALMDSAIIATLKESWRYFLPGGMTCLLEHCAELLNK